MPGHARPTCTSMPPTPTHSCLSYLIDRLPLPLAPLPAVAFIVSAQYCYNWTGTDTTDATLTSAGRSGKQNRSSNRTIHSIS